MANPEMLKAEFAAALAPEVDRLFIAGHRAAAPRARSLREELGMLNFGVLIDLRKLLLVPGGMELRQAEALERYQDPGRIAATLETHIDQGFLTRSGTAFVPTERGRQVLLRLSMILEEAVTGLWNGQPGLAAADTARVLVLHARRSLAGSRSPAFTAESSGYMPETAGIPFLLWSCLASLRYLRADAHALAWTEEGFSAPEISILTVLCNRTASSSVSSLTGLAYGGEPGVASALDSLQLRGCARQINTHWEATPDGREVRRQIETRTNEYNVRALADMTDDERTAFLATLRSLPSVPP